jgi:hypothetical protein
MADATAKLVAFKNAGITGWLLLAILVHACLLLIPSRQALPPAQALHRLAVSLQRSARPPWPDPESTLPEQSVPPTMPPSHAVVESADVEPKRTNPPAPPAQEVGLPPALSAAHLLDLASRLQFDQKPAADSRDLGVFRPQPLPENWGPGVPKEANRFDGMVVPDEVEIVDRWLAADGSHNVVVNTPSGDTYCGRAEAWTPLNPLFEPIMMWRPCGGGGKRSFEMPARYRKSPGESGPQQ